MKGHSKLKGDQMNRKLYLERGNAENRDLIKDWLRKKLGEEGDRVVAYIPSKEGYWRSAINRWPNWVVHNTANTPLFDIRFDLNDNKDTHGSLQPWQLCNHFVGNRAITTKVGLNKSLLLHEANERTDEWYPRSYDFSDQQQINDFVWDFYETGILSIIKKHSTMFLERNR